MLTSIKTATEKIAKAVVFRGDYMKNSTPLNIILQEWNALSEEIHQTVENECTDLIS